MLLAIDTATAYMSLALHDDQRVIAESTWVSPNNHTVELAPAVHAMLVRAGIAIDALTALAVAIGPGSYSALRIGVSFAKAVAAARELPLIGMTTLDILSASQHRYPGELIPTAQAGRGRVIAARYTWNAVINRWTRAELMQNWEWAALIAAIEQRATPTWVTGEIDADAEHAGDRRNRRRRRTCDRSSERADYVGRYRFTAAACGLFGERSIGAVARQR